MNLEKTNNYQLNNSTLNGGWSVMLFIKRFTKVIASAVLIAFVYTGVMHQALYGAITLAQENSPEKIAKLSEKIDKFVLPYNFGSISDGQKFAGNKLVVFIQDLHCHPQVQKNIFEIIKLFDNRLGVKKVLVEGAPEGKVDTALLSSIPGETARQKALNSLLEAGLLSGAEYYEVTQNKDNLSGIENWDIYSQNLMRAKELLASKQENLSSVFRIKQQIAILKKEYLSSGANALEEKINKLKTAKGKTHKYYEYIAKLDRELNLGIALYPNLQKYSNLIQLNHQIKYDRLTNEMGAYAKELQSFLPYQIYAQLIDKLKDKSKIEEYYLGLADVADAYTPTLSASMPNLAKFFSYLRLNYSINQIQLMQEEELFVKEAISRKVSSLSDKEILFLERMSNALESVVTFKILPKEYEYFSKNTKNFQLALSKYLSPADALEVEKILSKADCFEFYNTNENRNAIFCAAIENELKKGSAISNKSIENAATVNESLPLSNTYADVLQNLNSFNEVYIVVAGGYHLELSQMLSQRGISYLSITPNATKKFDETIYERVLVGNYYPKEVLMSAFQVPLMVLMNIKGEQANSKIVLLAQTLANAYAQEGNSKEKIAQLINEWGKNSGTNVNAKSNVKNEITVSFGEGNEYSWTITLDKKTNKVLEIIPFGSLAKDAYNEANLQIPTMPTNNMVQNSYQQVYAEHLQKLLKDENGNKVSFWQFLKRFINLPPKVIIKSIITHPLGFFPLGVETVFLGIAGSGIRTMLLTASFDPTLVVLLGTVSLLTLGFAFAIMHPDVRKDIKERGFLNVLISRKLAARIVGGIVFAMPFLFASSPIGITIASLVSTSTHVLLNLLSITSFDGVLPTFNTLEELQEEQKAKGIFPVAFRAGENLLTLMLKDSIGNIKEVTGGDIGLLSLDTKNAKIISRDPSNGNKGVLIGIKKGSEPFINAIVIVDKNNKPIKIYVNNFFKVENERFLEFRESAFDGSEIDRNFFINLKKLIYDQVSQLNINSLKPGTNYNLLTIPSASYISRRLVYLMRSVKRSEKAIRFLLNLSYAGNFYLFNGMIILDRTSQGEYFEEKGITLLTNRMDNALIGRSFIHEFAHHIHYGIIEAANAGDESAKEKRTAIKEHFNKKKKFLLNFVQKGLYRDGNLEALLKGQNEIPEKLISEAFAYTLEYIIAGGSNRANANLFDVEFFKKLGLLPQDFDDSDIFSSNQKELTEEEFKQRVMSYYLNLSAGNTKVYAERLQKLLKDESGNKVIFLQFLNRFINLPPKVIIKSIITYPLGLYPLGFETVLSGFSGISIAKSMLMLSAFDPTFVVAIGTAALLAWGFAFALMHPDGRADIKRSGFLGALKSKNFGARALGGVAFALPFLFVSSPFGVVLAGFASATLHAVLNTLAITKLQGIIPVFNASEKGQLKLKILVDKTEISTDVEYDKFLKLLDMSRKFLQGISQDELLKIIKKVSKNETLSWDNLGNEAHISYFAEGANKYVFKVKFQAKDGTAISVLLAAKKEKSKGDITGHELHNLKKLSDRKSKTVPVFGGNFVDSDGRTWYIEEFIEGPTIKELEKSGALTVKIRKAIVSVLLSMAIGLNGETPLDAHGGNFIFGDRRLSIFGKNANFQHRLIFMAIMAAQYGIVGENGTRDVDFIFDAIMQSDSPEAGIEFLRQVNEGIKASDKSKLLDVLIAKGRNMLWLLGNSKEERVKYENFFDNFSNSLDSYITRIEKIKNASIDNNLSLDNSLTRAPPSSSVVNKAEVEKALDEIMACVPVTVKDLNEAELDSIGKEISVRDNALGSKLDQYFKDIYVSKESIARKMAADYPQRNYEISRLGVAIFLFMSRRSGYISNQKLAVVTKILTNTVVDQNFDNSEALIFNNSEVLKEQIEGFDVNDKRYIKVGAKHIEQMITISADRDPEHNSADIYLLTTVAHELGHMVLNVIGYDKGDLDGTVAQEFFADIYGLAFISRIGLSDEIISKKNDYEAILENVKESGYKTKKTHNAARAQLQAIRVAAGISNKKIDYEKLLVLTLNLLRAPENRFLAFRSIAWKVVFWYLQEKKTIHMTDKSTKFIALDNKKVLILSLEKIIDIFKTFGYSALATNSNIGGTIVFLQNFISGFQKDAKARNKFNKNYWLIAPVLENFIAFIAYFSMAYFIGFGSSIVFVWEAFFILHAVDLGLNFARTQSGKISSINMIFAGIISAFGIAFGFSPINPVMLGLHFGLNLIGKVVRLIKESKEKRTKKPTGAYYYQSNSDLAKAEYKKQLAELKQRNITRWKNALRVVSAVLPIVAIIAMANKIVIANVNEDALTFVGSVYYSEEVSVESKPAVIKVTPTNTNSQENSGELKKNLGQKEADTKEVNAIDKKLSAMQVDMQEQLKARGFIEPHVSKEKLAAMAKLCVANGNSIDKNISQIAALMGLHLSVPARATTYNPFMALQASKSGNKNTLKKALINTTRENLKLMKKGELPLVSSGEKFNPLLLLRVDNDGRFLRWELNPGGHIAAPKGVSGPVIANIKGIGYVLAIAADTGGAIKFERSGKGGKIKRARIDLGYVALLDGVAPTEENLIAKTNEINQFITPYITTFHGKLFLKNLFSIALFFGAGFILQSLLGGFDSVGTTLAAGAFIGGVSFKNSEKQPEINKNLIDLDSIAPSFMKDGKYKKIKLSGSEEYVTQHFKSELAKQENGADMYTPDEYVSVQLAITKPYGGTSYILLFDKASVLLNKANKITESVDSTKLAKTFKITDFAFSFNFEVYPIKEVVAIHRVNNALTKEIAGNSPVSEVFSNTASALEGLYDGYKIFANAVEISEQERVVSRILAPEKPFVTQKKETKTEQNIKFMVIPYLMYKYFRAGSATAKNIADYFPNEVFFYTNASLIGQVGSRATNMEVEIYKLISNRAIAFSNRQKGSNKISELTYRNIIVPYALASSKGKPYKSYLPLETEANDLATAIKELTTYGAKAISVDNNQPTLSKDIIDLILGLGKGVSPDQIYDKIRRAINNNNPTLLKSIVIDVAGLLDNETISIAQVETTINWLEDIYILATKEEQENEICKIIATALLKIEEPKVSLPARKKFTRKEAYVRFVQEMCRNDNGGLFVKAVISVWANQAESNWNTTLLTTVLGELANDEFDKGNLKSDAALAAVLTRAYNGVNGTTMLRKTLIAHLFDQLSGNGFGSINANKAVVEFALTQLQAVNIAMTDNEIDEADKAKHNIGYIFISVLNNIYRSTIKPEFAKLQSGEQKETLALLDRIIDGLNEIIKNKSSNKSLVADSLSLLGDISGNKNTNFADKAKTARSIVINELTQSVDILQRTHIIKVVNDLLAEKNPENFANKFRELEGFPKVGYFVLYLKKYDIQCIKAVADNDTLDIVPRIYALNVYGDYIKIYPKAGFIDNFAELFSKVSLANKGGMPACQQLIRKVSSDSGSIRAILSDNVVLQNEEVIVLQMALLLSAHRYFLENGLKLASKEELLGIIQHINKMVISHSAENVNINDIGVIFFKKHNYDPAFFFEVLGHELGHRILNEYGYNNDILAVGIMHELFADLFALSVGSMIGQSKEVNENRANDYQDRVNYLTQLQKVSKDGDTATEAHQGARAQLSIIMNSLKSEGIPFSPPVMLVAAKEVLSKPGNQTISVKKATGLILKLYYQILTQKNWRELAKKSSQKSISSISSIDMDNVFGTLKVSKERVLGYAALKILFNKFKKLMKKGGINFSVPLGSIFDFFFTGSNFNKASALRQFLKSPFSSSPARSYVLSTVVAVPILEELLFRGVVLGFGYFILITSLGIASLAALVASFAASVALFAMAHIIRDWFIRAKLGGAEAVFNTSSFKEDAKYFIPSIIFPVVYVAVFGVLNTILVEANLSLIIFLSTFASIKVHSIYNKLVLSGKLPKLLNWLPLMSTPMESDAVSYDGHKYSFDVIRTMLQNKDQLIFGLLLYDTISDSLKDKFELSVPLELRNILQAHRNAPKTLPTEPMIKYLDNTDCTMRINDAATMQVGIGQNIQKSPVQFFIQPIRGKSKIALNIVSEGKTIYSSSEIDFDATYIIASEQLDDVSLNNARFIAVESPFITAGKHFSFRIFSKGDETWVTVVDYKSTNGTILFADVYSGTLTYPRRSEDLSFYQQEIADMVDTYSDRMQADGPATDPNTKNTHYWQSLNEAAQLYLETAEFYELQDQRKALLTIYFFANIVGGKDSSSGRKEYALKALEDLLDDDRISVWEPILDVAVAYVSIFTHLISLLANEKIRLAPARLQREMLSALSKKAGNALLQLNVPHIPRLAGTSPDINDINSKTIRIPLMPDDVNVRRPLILPSTYALGKWLGMSERGSELVIAPFVALYDLPLHLGYMIKDWITGKWLDKPRFFGGVAILGFTGVVVMFTHALLAAYIAYSISHLVYNFIYKSTLRSIISTRKDAPKVIKSGLDKTVSLQNPAGVLSAVNGIVSGSSELNWSVKNAPELAGKGYARVTNDISEQEIARIKGLKELGIKAFGINFQTFQNAEEPLVRLPIGLNNYEALVYFNEKTGFYSLAFHDAEIQKMSQKDQQEYFAMATLALLQDLKSGKLSKDMEVPIETAVVSTDISLVIPNVLKQLINSDDNEYYNAVWQDMLQSEYLNGISYIYTDTTISLDVELDKLGKASADYVDSLDNKQENDWKINKNIGEYIVNILRPARNSKPVIAGKKSIEKTKDSFITTSIIAASFPFASLPAGTSLKSYYQAVLKNSGINIVVLGVSDLENYIEISKQITNAKASGAIVYLETSSVEVIAKYAQVIDGIRLLGTLEAQAKQEIADKFPNKAVYFENDPQWLEVPLEDIANVKKRIESNKNCKVISVEIATENTNVPSSLSIEKLSEIVKGIIPQKDSFKAGYNDGLNIKLEGNMAEVVKNHSSELWQIINAYYAFNSGRISEPDYSKLPQQTQGMSKWLDMRVQKHIRQIDLAKDVQSKENAFKELSGFLLGLVENVESGTPEFKQFKAIARGQFISQETWHKLLNLQAKDVFAENLMKAILGIDNKKIIPSLSSAQLMQLRAKTCGFEQENITEQEISLIIARFNTSGYVAGINKGGAQQSVKTITTTDPLVLADVLNHLYIIEQQAKENKVASKISVLVDVELLKGMLRAG